MTRGAEPANPPLPSPPAPPDRSFRAFFDTIDDAACLIERLPLRADGRRDYRYTAMNPAMQAMFGIPDLTGQSIRDNFPDEVEDWYDDYDRVLDSGVATRLERASEPQGIVLEMFIARLATGAGPQLMLVMQNVTARRHIEAALLASETRQAFLLTLADRLRPLADAAEIMTAASEALGRHLAVGRCGYGEVDDEGDCLVVERDWTDGVMASFTGALRLDHFGDELLAAYRAGQVVTIDDALADARTRGLEGAFAAIGGVRASLAVPLVKDGRWVATLYLQQTTPRRWTAADETLARDVAERTWEAVERARAEGASHDSEAQFRALHDAIDEGFCTLEMLFDDAQRPIDYRFLTTSPSFEKQTGLRQVVGRRMRELVPDHEQHWFDIYGRVALTREPVRFENQAEGLGRWYDVFAFPTGEPHEHRIAVLFNDVTVRKRAEEELRDSSRRKDEFLAILAHELRNPLAPIRTGLEMIRVAGNTPEAVERVRGIMDRQVTHMVRLIDDLLDVSRISSGKIQLRRDPTPLTTLVNSAIEANRAAIAAKRLDLRVALPDALCVLDVDPTRFVQVISNLLHNATKFTDAGGAITVRAHVASDDGGPTLTLSVADSGIGISREFLPHVFNLFTQDPDGAAQTGLGIGLALARQLVEMQGGTISVHSDGLGQGSEFVLRFPVSAQSAADRAPSTARASAIGCRVVVIDDNRDAAQTLSMLIEAMGGSTRTAFDGESGLRLIDDDPPDLVLLDIGMPGLDGYETCRRIRQTIGPGITVVAITGYGQQQDKERAVQAGFNAHLTKPADPGTLRTLLTDCAKC